MEEMMSIYASGGAVDALGEYLCFLLMLAERNPYFWCPSVNASQLLKLS
jgi:hypothetical protein